MNTKKPAIIQVDIVCADGKTYSHSMDGEYEESYIDLEIIPFGDIPVGTVRVAEVLVDPDGSITTNEAYYAQPIAVMIYYETEVSKDIKVSE